MLPLSLTGAKFGSDESAPKTPPYPACLLVNKRITTTTFFGQADRLPAHDGDSKITFGTFYIQPDEFAPRTEVAISEYNLLDTHR